VEFSSEDFPLAERTAKRLGYKQTAYTSTSALWGLYCLRDRATQKAGCIIKTKELGLMFVQCLDDLNMEDMARDAIEEEAGLRAELFAKGRERARKRERRKAGKP
jgi:hypothetical protein